MKTALIHGLTASALSSIAGIVFNTVYKEALFVDFSVIINPMSITSACTFGCMLASLGYWILGKWMTKAKNVVFNIIFLIITFASLVSSFAAELPLDVEFPEMFIGLSIPLHFFPILFWLASKPLFNKA